MTDSTPLELRRRRDQARELANKALPRLDEKPGEVAAFLAPTTERRINDPRWRAPDPSPCHITADLIVMTTDGPDGFLDGLRGTTSVHVLNRARCPVANLPVGARLAA